MQEPLLGCPVCGIKMTFKQGAEKGMSCPICNVRLEMVDLPSQDGEQQLSGFSSRIPYQGDGVLSSSSNDPIRVAELWIPAHNEMDDPAVSQFIAALPCPVGLEYLGAGSRRSMLVRAPYSNLKHIAGMIISTWPSAYLQILDEDPLDAPLQSPDIDKYSVNITLESPGYLPLRTWLTYLKGDPVHNILSATLGLNPEERLWLQVLGLEKSEPEWLRDVQRRLKLEQQRGFVVNNDNQTATAVNAMPVQSINYRQGFAFLGYIFLALAVVAVGLFKGWLWFAAAVILAAFLGYGIYKLSRPKEDEWYNADLALIRQKTVQQDSFFKVSIRASVWAKNPDRARELVQRILSALSQYTITGGNRLIVSDRELSDTSPWPISALQSSKEGELWGWLSPVEMGGFWHPPVNNDRVSPGLIPVRGVEVRAPDPEDVKGFYEIGKYFRPDGEMEPVMISSETLRHNIFLIGKPGVGKSNLMEHLALAGLDDPETPAIVVIDPHGDMANRLISTVDSKHLDRIVYMDIADQDYILTYNPLDVHSHGWTVEQTSQLIVDIGRSLWSEYWGPRMQVPLKRAVEAIAATNALRDPGQALGLSLLSSFLNIDKDDRSKFISVELEKSEFKGPISRYFNGDYAKLSQSMREQIVQPVLSKGYRFEESPMLEFFSSPSSKLNPAEIINNRKMLIVNTRMSRYGAEISDFVGSMIVNVLMREINRQGEVNSNKRAPVMLVIDEFQTFTGVPWQELVAQLRKYGGRTILGTQSLASLKVEDSTLVGVIMSGVYSVFGFMMNGEDARYMSENELSEKDGGPTMSTLTSLDPFHAYARTVRPDGRVTRPYYFVAAAPAAVVPGQAEKVLEARKKYSVYRDVAKREALDGLLYMEKYTSQLMSTGAGGFQAAGSRATKGGGATQRAALQSGARAAGTLQLGLDGFIDTSNASSSRAVSSSAPSGPLVLHKPSVSAVIDQPEEPEKEDDGLAIDINAGTGILDNAGLSDNQLSELDAAMADEDDDTFGLISALDNIGDDEDGDETPSDSRSLSDGQAGAVLDGVDY